MKPIFKDKPLTTKINLKIIHRKEINIKTTDYTDFLLNSGLVNTVLWDKWYISIYTLHNMLDEDNRSERGKTRLNFNFSQKNVKF